ncbi:hypothetical protein IAU60_000160 [Kwoniella sp. DSM 27419]
MDDLLDLSWSDPAKAIATKPAVTSSTPASFDFLSAAKPVSGTGTPNYYSSTPLRTGTPTQQPASNVTVSQGARPGQPLAPASGRHTPVQNALPAATSSANSGGLDAFSSLLAMPSVPGGPMKQTMTMAERQKAAEDERKRKEEEDRRRFEAEGDFWDNLGSSSKSGSAGLPAVNRPTLASNDLLKPATAAVASRGTSPIQLSSDLLAPAPARAPSTTSKSAGTFWDQYEPGLTPQTTASKPKSSTPPSDPFDFDTLAQSVPGGSNGSSVKTPATSFNVGNTGGSGGLLDDDDILGDLAKPVSTMPTSAKPQPGPSQAPRQSMTQRSMSPPPHVVGQIVEMGFSPQQARQALAKTETGVDVQAALEMLLGGQGTVRQPPSRTQGSASEDEGDDDMVEMQRRRREEEEREKRRRRRAGPSRDSVRARTQEERDEEATTAEQAEKYLAQASEIGANMFSKATSFWNSSKEKALKVYEEQRKAMEAAAAKETGDGARKPVRDGRPKWMTEAASDESGDERPDQAGGFKDSDEEEEFRTVPRQTRREVNNAIGGPSRQSRPVETNGRDRQDAPYRSAKERADLLFADEEPKRYVSPARHLKKPAATAVPPRARAATPVVALRKRQLVPADSQQLQAAAKHKLMGNEHFKLGRFAEADSAYSTAISSLPEGHLFLVPLHNNRAAARLKLGDSAPAASDCTVVIDLIGPSYHPSKEAPLPAEIASEVKLADGLVKAMTKRAQAWEMGEKWKNAVDDWVRVMGMDLSMLGSGAASTKSLAAEGARRSRKMLEGGEARPVVAQSSKPALPKPKPRPVASAANVDKSAAVSELRKAAQVQEAEDEQRHALKDAVDAKLNAWKGGKETNLRALIASLDTVLWDEMLKGGLKVGMHELITEKQVKIKYMKVIARLHPDKISATNTTVEQRMLANGAFGALNDAWQAFSK